MYGRISLDCADFFCPIIIKTKSILLTILHNRILSVKSLLSFNLVQDLMLFFFFFLLFEKKEEEKTHFGSTAKVKKIVENLRISLS